MTTNVPMLSTNYEASHLEQGLPQAIDAEQRLLKAGLDLDLSRSPTDRSNLCHKRSPKRPVPNFEKKSKKPTAYFGLARALEKLSKY